MDNATEVHGHEILKLIHNAARPFTRETLRQAAGSRFGKDARYCTCSADNLTLDNLVNFLLERGKLVEEQGEIRADISQMCGDGEGGHEH